MEFNFDEKGAKIAGALCFDGERENGKQQYKKDLTSVGDGIYVDADGLRYERPLPRDVDGPGPRFVRIEDEK